LHGAYVNVNAINNYSSVSCCIEYSLLWPTQMILVLGIVLFRNSGIFNTLSH
jgi:hypothetical protein